MRKFCLHCTIKHIAQAYVMEGEVNQGYPEHILGVIGHLAEASEECIEASPELAKKIRQKRLLVLNSLIDIMDNGKTTEIDYFDLFNDAIQVMKDKGCGNCTKSEESFKERLEKRKLESV